MPQLPMPLAYSKLTIPSGRNAFLHRQLENCSKEVAALRDEVRSLKVNDLAVNHEEIVGVKASLKIHGSTVQEVLALVEQHEPRLDETRTHIGQVQQSLGAMQEDITMLKESTARAQKTEADHRVSLEGRLGAMRADCEKEASSHRRQVQRIVVSVENLQSALEDKADVTSLRMLEDQVTNLHAGGLRPNTVLDSISVVSDTLEGSQDVPQPGKSPARFPDSIVVVSDLQTQMNLFKFEILRINTDETRQAC